MLNELTKLAEVESSEKRRELMSNIADLFMQQSDNASDNEINIFGDILTKLLNVMDEEGKTSISDDFSRLDNAPKSFAMALANESAAVANPMLTNSKVYTDDDLIKISQNKDENHRVAISNRETVSENVTDSLISFGESTVMQSVTRNKGAAISNDGLRKIVTHAQDDQKLASNLVSRVNIFDQLKGVLPTLSSESQKQFNNVLIANNPAELEALMETANKELARSRLLKKTDQIQAKAEINKINKGSLTKDDAIIKFAKSDKPAKISTLFASFVKLDQKYISNSLLQMNSDALVVLCKSVDISVEAVREIGEMRCRILHMPSSTVDKFVNDFKNMDEDASQRTMRFVGLQANLKKSIV